MQILYHDKHIAVCIKPVGVDSQQQLPQLLRQALGGDFYPVHRLDQNVAGLMVYARTSPVAAELSLQIQQGTFIKEYVALVHGTPPESGDWTDLLFKDSRKNKVFVVAKPRAGVRQARLTFTRLAAGERSPVRIRLYTGRSHQIRVQFASRGFPLVGDHKYGSRARETAPMLFSCALTFTVKGQARHFQAMPAWLSFDSEGEMIRE